MTARIGQIYERREPAGDEFDRLRVVGLGAEISLQSADEFSDVIAADPAMLAEHYALAQDVPEPVAVQLGDDVLAAWLA